MSIFLAQLASDNFQRANESPLIHPPWSTDTFGQAGLQIISHLAQGTATNTDCTEIYTGVSLPNDQYASATLGAGILGNANLVLGVRMVDNGSVSLGGMPGYFTRISGTSNGGTWTIQDGSGGHVLTNGAGLTVNSGDVFVLAVIGTTIYLFQNGVQITSVVNALWSSGSAMLVCATGTSASAVQVSAFATGKASLTPGGTGTGYSVPDCRVSPAGPNSSRVVQGTLIYDVQTSSNPAIPPTDSRATGAPVDSRQSSQTPLNSRTPGVFGPEE
jgi:hypothetical protein